MAAPWFYVDEILDDEITIRIYPESPYTYFEYFIRKNGESGYVYPPQIIGPKSDRFTLTFGDLEPGTSYIINIGYRSWSGGSNAGLCGAQTVTTTQSHPQVTDRGRINSVYTDQTSLTVYFSSIANATKYQVVLRIDGTQTTTTKIVYDTYCEFKGLTPGTTYVLNYQGGNDYYTEWGPFTTAYRVTLPKNKPTKWSWQNTNGPKYYASAAETRKAHTAVTGNGKTTDFSYKVWNDLCEKTNEVRDVAGFTWNSTYANLANTKMSGPGEILTAQKFNSLRYNVYTGWAAVKKGDPVYGRYFTEIANQINSWIDSL